MKKKVIDIDYCLTQGGSLEGNLSNLAEKVRAKIKEGWQPSGPPVLESDFKRHGAWVQKIVKYDNPV